MLINKTQQIEEGEVVTFKISTGEEIIGKVSKVTDTEFSVNKPMTMVNTQQGVTLAPAVVLGDPEGDVTYFKQHMIALMKTRKQVEEAYLSMSSGIQIASADAIKQ